MSYRIFTPSADAKFISRPNRFTVRARITDTGDEVSVHCPNPGRMRELLQTGRRIILEHSDSPGRKTPWTLAAVEYRDSIIPLVSARSNAAAAELAIPVLYPGYESLAEQSLGRSRIDWKLTKGTGHLWVEVKACTLVEHSRAMFPDAPSERAVKHLEELSETGDSAAVVFTVMNPDAEVFSANPHTDPAFSIAMEKAFRRGVRFHAVSMKCDPSGSLETVNINLPVDFSPSVLAGRDEGIVLKCWSDPKNGSALTLERTESGLSRVVRSRRRPAGIDSAASPEAVFPIRGPMHVFGSIEVVLSRFLESNGTGVWLGVRIPENEHFINLLLDYRHRRIFEA